jgi:hypothetical protein
MKKLLSTCAVLLIVPFVLMGCEADPVEPELALSDVIGAGLPAGLFAEGDDGQPIEQLASFRSGVAHGTFARAMIGRDGGRLELGAFAVEVPAGAVHRPTEFTIQLPADGSDGSERVVAQFGPAGASFAEPVTIRFPYAGTTIDGEDDPIVVWWNDGWVNMGGTVSEDGATIQTTTDHFSTYGTTTESRGGEGVIVVGG